MNSDLALFVVRRLAWALALVLVVSSAAFTLIHLAPGDVFSTFNMDAATAAAERSRAGLDRPFLVQYGEWITRLLVFDFGESVRFRRPVGALIQERAGNTLILGGAALVLALALGLPAGVRTGSAPDHWGSRLIRGASLLLVSVPPLITALVLLLVATKTGWFAPPDTDSSATAFWRSIDALRALPLPALALALPVSASIERLQSSAMRDALSEPSIVAARARGISQARATWTHAWRLALRPVLGVVGIVVGTVLSGSFAVEIVMGWPGLGDLMYQSLVARDLFLAAGCAAFGALVLGLAILTADLLLAILDPRTVGDLAR